ncbi:head maturation protease, ClpP-related [Roseivivax isoporae]|uniref:ATP-dependent Clp protease proteolytic subunit n=1 Tax=Roseivivax isoporae LMG 25204 TaxID=1449351 RepID=X7F3A8_9RHOB|nr:head maturation protease, ClpP-related [Roseivivax isoporae]ETX26561.1 hypothetical protein RISW2_21990 [Roseivivax isoporae LMG 25204]
MSLRNLPELNADRLPKVCAFELDDAALERWNAAVQPKAAGETTITILDAIGEDWDGSGVTARRVAAALRSIGEKEVTVEINSPGGDFFEGVAIYNALRAHPQKVTVRILGLAASAASVIAMAGDEIQIGKAGFMMVHNAWVMAIGNRHDLREAADMMEPFDDAMATLYASRAGVAKPEAAAWMDKETWFNGEQAVEAGLADGYLPADAVVEDAARAREQSGVKAVKRIDVALARNGIPRSERRALLAEVKGGTQDAAPTVTHDADEWTAAARQLITTISS